MGSNSARGMDVLYLRFSPCVCVVLCRQRPWDGLISHPRSLTNCPYDSFRLILNGNRPQGLIRQRKEEEVSPIGARSRELLCRVESYQQNAADFSAAFTCDIRPQFYTVCMRPVICSGYEVRTSTHISKLQELQVIKKRCLKMTEDNLDQQVLISYYYSTV
jgi:hypothetical protein